MTRDFIHASLLEWGEREHRVNQKTPTEGALDCK
jgi:hypothetical protein